MGEKNGESELKSGSLRIRRWSSDN